MEVKNIYDEFIDWYAENESAYLFLSRSGDIRCKSEREEDELHIVELFIRSFTTGVYEFGMRFPVVKNCHEYRKRLFERLFNVFSAHSVAVRSKRPELKMKLCLRGFKL